MSEQPIVITPTSPRVVLVGPGRQGPPGPTGPAGPVGPAGAGVPPGGTDGELLEKSGSTDYVYQWMARPRLLVLDQGAPVPEGTPVGTVIFRRSA